jgi:hypothetical protein
VVLYVFSFQFEDRMFNDTILSFRQYCLNSTLLPADLHIKLSDITSKAGTLSNKNHFEKLTKELKFIFPFK